MQARLLPGTPDTQDLAALFRLLFEPEDADWIEAIDAPTLQRAGADPGARPPRPGARTLLDAITILVSAVHAAGYAPALRQRMDSRAAAGRTLPPAHGDAPARCAARCSRAAHAEALQEAAYLRALLDACRRAGRQRARRTWSSSASRSTSSSTSTRCRAARAASSSCSSACWRPTRRRSGGGCWRRWCARSPRSAACAALLARHYSLLARQVTERSAETGEHYITRDRDEYRDMLRRAAGGGAVIAGTTFVKFAIAAVGLSAFWTGFWSGANYAASFVVVMLLHWTVATKQPAMTAPALAASLPAAGGTASDDARSRPSSTAWRS